MTHNPKITDIESQNGVISSISLNLDKRYFWRTFGDFMEDGWIAANKFSLPETFEGNLSDSLNSLRGKKAEVFSDGTKLLEGTFDQSTEINNGQDYISLGFDFNEDMIQDSDNPKNRIPDLEDLPSDIESGEDFAEAFDIGNLSFKVVKEAKDKVKNTSRSETAEAAKDKVKNTSPSEAAEAANKYKGIIQLGVLAVGIAGTVGAYVWGKN